MADMGMVLVGEVSRPPTTLTSG